MKRRAALSAAGHVAPSAPSARRPEPPDGHLDDYWESNGPANGPGRAALRCGGMLFFARAEIEGSLFHDWVLRLHCNS